MLWDPGIKYRKMWTKQERKEHVKLREKLAKMRKKFYENNPSPKLKRKK